MGLRRSYLLLVVQSILLLFAVQCRSASTLNIETAEVMFTVYNTSTAWSQSLSQDLATLLSPMFSNRTVVLSIAARTGGSVVTLGFLPAPGAGNEPVGGPSWMSVFLTDLADWRADPLGFPNFLPNGTATEAIDLTAALPTAVTRAIHVCDHAPANSWSLSCPDTGPNPPDWGILGIAIGLGLSFLALGACIVLVGTAYCRHEKKGPWAPLTRRKRQINEEQKQQVDHSKSDFKQQRFKYWTPQMTPLWVVGAYTVVGVVFLIIGPVLYADQANVHEFYTRYDNLPQCQTAMAQNLNQPYDTPVAPNATPRGTCTVSIAIEEDMDPPVFFYYRLTNFYQNHWRYVKSRDDKSNRNKGTSASDCKPDIGFGAGDIQKTAEFLYPLNVAPYLLNASFFVGKDLYPCGLVAQSWFNDKFTEPCVHVAGSSACEFLDGDNWNKTGIAWSRDLSKRFVPRPIDPFSETNYNPRGFVMPAVNDEDFVVWMRQAALPTFEKLNKRILNRGFRKGEVLNVTVENNFPVHMWAGHKGVMLATANSLGTKNYVLGAAFIVIGVFAVLVALAFAVKIRLDVRWEAQQLRLVASPQGAGDQAS